jgi:hypothetical protein
MVEPSAPAQGPGGRGADPAKLTLALNDVKQSDAEKKTTKPLDAYDEEDDAPTNNKSKKVNKPPPAAGFLCFTKKLDNRMQYLSSLLIDKNKALVRAFDILEVSRMEQVRLLELWWSTCEDRPRMHYSEFVSLGRLDA